jgi:hypothetical protein
MRHLLGFSLLATAVLVSLPGLAAPREAAVSPTEGPLDRLGREILRALKTRDSGALMETTAKREDLEAVLEQRAASMEDEAQAAELLQKGRQEIERRFAPDRVRDLRADQAENFAETIGAEDWSKAELVGIGYEVDVEAVAQLRLAEIELVLRIGGGEVTVKVDELVETPNGWLTIENNPLRVRAD